MPKRGIAGAKYKDEQKGKGYPDSKKAAQIAKQLTQKETQLFHPDFGIITMAGQSDFAKRFDLLQSKISLVINAIRPVHKGWRLPIEQKDYCKIEAK